MRAEPRPESWLRYRLNASDRRHIGPIITGTERVSGKVMRSVVCVRFTVRFHSHPVIVLFLVSYTTGVGTGLADPAAVDQ